MKTAKTGVEASKHMERDEGYRSGEYCGAAISSPCLAASPGSGPRPPASRLDPHPAHGQHVLVQLVLELRLHSTSHTRHWESQDYFIVIFTSFGYGAY